MKIICGLGNPGKQYENTHHNMGFMAVDKLAGRFGIQINKLKFKALIGEGRIGSEKVILVKPQTFMNLSGEALRPIMDFYKAEPKDLMLIYDDVDIPLGTLRLREKGSAGSHNGMKSVIFQLGYDTFPRLRIGIGGQTEIPLMSYVLMAVSNEEHKLLDPAILKACETIEVWIQKGVNPALMLANNNAGGKAAERAPNPAEKKIPKSEAAEEKK